MLRLALDDIDIRRGALQNVHKLSDLGAVLGHDGSADNVAYEERALGQLRVGAQN